MAGDKVRVSISLTPEIAEEARRRGGRGGLSAYATAAVSRALERERLREIIEAAEAEHGPLTEEEIAAADRAIAEAHRRIGRRSERRGTA